MTGQARQAAYGPAKFVASGLTEHLAVSWGAGGTRSNAVAPVNGATPPPGTGGAGFTDERGS